MLPNMDALRVVGEMIARIAAALERIADALETRNEDDGVPHGVVEQ